MNVASRSRSSPALAGMSKSSDVDMYSEVPSFELSLDEFEEYALARLKVLRKIEEMQTRNIPADPFRIQLASSLKSTSLSSSKKVDVASHFILRAAYCRTEDLRRWFLTQECRLFRHRLETCCSNNPEGLREFLQINHFRLDKLSDREKDRLRDKLLSTPGGPSPIEFHTTEYYRVPFLEALELVAKRECFLEKGFAHVPFARVVAIVAAKYRASLSKSLVRAAAMFGQAVHDEQTRIGPLLHTMNSQSTGPRTMTELGESVLTAATVDTLATQSMPLCMQQLHAGLQRDHKLKHHGRLQYGLFLKGAGMSLEEHTIFFQREFTRIMSTEQFHKQYLYSIRHIHGKEGKRATYTPYNCMKIVLGSPPQSGVEHHGCPYKHYDDQNLSALLTKLKIGNLSERESILRHKKEGNFQLACTKHFEILHPSSMSVEGVSLEGVGNHPNAWFAASVSYHTAKTAGRSGSTNNHIMGQEQADVKLQ